MYRDLLDPSDDGYTKKERIFNTGESLFPDEASVEVYVDLMFNNKIKSNGVCRVGLREAMMELAGSFADNAGTPQSIIAEAKPRYQGVIDDSAYTASSTKQNKSTIAGPFGRFGRMRFPSRPASAPKNVFPYFSGVASAPRPGCGRRQNCGKAWFPYVTKIFDFAA